MDLHAQPFHLEFELFFKLFDKPLADVAEGSDVVGEDAEGYAHEIMIPPFGGGRKDRSAAKKAVPLPRFWATIGR